MMLKSGATPAAQKKQRPSRSGVCRLCGSAFVHFSKTLPPKICQPCTLARRRESDRILAERKRRKRGVQPLKGVLTPCARCGSEFVRTNIKHVYCDPCGEENYRARTRAASKRKHSTPEGRVSTNKWIRDRYNSDPAWRISAHMRVMMYRALRSKKAGRSWRDLVPYSLPELMDHLERQFLPGMTWENCGKWHLDHKIPRKYFQIKSEKDVAFKASWALDNLQPLWAIDNIRKGAKLPPA